MGWAAQGDTDVADAKTSPPQFGGRDGLDIFNCFTEHSSFQARKVEALRQSRTDALAIASRVTCAAHGASSGHALAVPQNSLLGTETNYGHPRGLVVLLLVILIFIPHESKSPPSHDEMPSEMFRTRRSLHPQPDYSAREALHRPRSISRVEIRLADSVSAVPRSASLQNSQSPCSGTSKPRAIARKCATSHKNSTGDSGSPLSSSPLSGHIPQTDLILQSAHFEIRRGWRCRTLNKN